MTARRLAPSLATPTSVLVSQAQPRTPEWFEQRRRGITATDMVKVMCPGEYGTALDVWAEKRDMGAEDSAGEAAYWGTIHEPAIANRWQELHPRATLRAIGTVAHVDHPHLLASLDRLVLGCPDGDGPCGLECKSRSAFVAGKWRHDVPDEPYVQVQHQMLVTGYRHMHVGVLFGGNTFRHYRVERGADDIAVIQQSADALWRDVQDGTPPQVAPSGALLESLKRLYPDRAGQAELPEAEIRALLAAWHEVKGHATRANRVAKTAKEALEAATAALVQHLGAAERLYAPDDPIPAVEYRLVERAGYTAKPSSWRELRVLNTAYLPGKAPAAGTDTTTDTALEAAS